MSESHVHIVVKSAVGTVSYCAHCGKIHVRYGPALLRLNQKRFEQLREFVRQSFQRHFAPPLNLTEDLSHTHTSAEETDKELQLRFSDISLCFNQSEALAFLDLLEEAWLTIQRSRLEKMFLL